MGPTFDSRFLTSITGYHIMVSMQIEIDGRDLTFRSS